MTLECKVFAPDTRSLLPVFLVLVVSLIVGLVCPPSHAEVRMGVELQAEYNDNLFLDESDQTEDLIYRVAPWIELTREWPRLLAELRYQPRFTWYEKNPENDLTGHNVDLNVSGRVSRTFNMALMGRFVRGEERLLERVNAPQSTRLPYESYASTLTGTWLTGKDAPFGFSISGETRDYNKDSVSQDSTQLGGRINGRQWVGEQNVVTLDTGYTEGEYDDSTSYALTSGIVGAEHVLMKRKRVFARLGYSNTTGDARANYTTLNPLVGVAGELKDVQYDIGVGLLFYDQEGSASTYYPSLVANVVGEKRWRRGEMTITLTSGYEEDFIESESPGFNAFVSAMVAGRYEIGPKWACDGSGELRGDDYKDNRFGQVDRNDGTLRLGVGIEHQLMRRTTLRMDYSFQARRSEIDRFEYEENSIVLTLNLFTL